jgi:DNA topoisomerase-3
MSNWTLGAGLAISARNYLEVFPWDFWKDKTMPRLLPNETYVGRLTLPFQPYVLVHGVGVMVRGGFGVRLDARSFIPSAIEFSEASTTAPQLLTEHELIALMDRDGIGTDATVAQHIKTIQDRVRLRCHICNTTCLSYLCCQGCCGLVVVICGDG